MDWKRTKLSYLLWALFLAMTALASWQILEVFCGQKGIHGSYIYLITAGVLLVGGLIGVGISVARNKLLPQVKENALAFRIIEAVILIAILVVGILLRIHRLTGAQGGNLYLLAEMRYRMPLPETAHVGENLYLAILHFICFMLGNIAKFCLRFQVILTILAGLVWYLGVRRLSGVMSALVFAGFYFMDDKMIDMACHLTAQPLILLLYGIGLCLIGAALKNHGKSFVAYLIAGLWIGITAHADILGFTLLAFALALWHLDKEKGEGRLYGKTAAAAFLFLGTSVAFLACEAIWSLIHWLRFGGSFMNAFGNQWQGIRNVEFIGLTAFRGSFSSYFGSICSVVLACVLAVGLCGFFRRDKKEQISPWVTILILTVCAMLLKQLPSLMGESVQQFGFSMSGIIDVPFDGSALTIVCFFVLAGIGISKVLSPEVLLSEQKEAKAKTKQSFSIRSIPENIRRRKAERKAALIYAVDHPEVMENKNPISKFLYARAKKRIESQREIDKVMYALNSLSGDHIVYEDFTRDPYPEASKEAGGLFHHKKHEEEPKKEAREETKAVIEEPKAVTDEPKPVVEDAKLAVEETKAVAEETKAVVEETKPVVEETKVVVEESKPVVEETKLVAEENKAVVEEIREAAKEQAETIKEQSIAPAVAVAKVASEENKAAVEEPVQEAAKKEMEDVAPAVQVEPKFATEQEIKVAAEEAIEVASPAKEEPKALVQEELEVIDLDAEEEPKDVANNVMLATALAAEEATLAAMKEIAALSEMKAEPEPEPEPEILPSPASEPEPEPEIATAPKLDDSPAPVTVPAEETPVLTETVASKEPEGPKFADMFGKEMTWDEVVKKPIAEEPKQEERVTEPVPVAETEKTNISENIMEASREDINEQTIVKEAPKAKEEDFDYLLEAMGIKAPEPVPAEETKTQQEDDLVILEEAIEPKAVVEDDSYEYQTLEEFINYKSPKPGSTSNSSKDAAVKAPVIPEIKEETVEAPTPVVEVEEKAPIQIVEIEDLEEPKKVEEPKPQKPKSEDFMYVSLHSGHSREHKAEEPKQQEETKDTDDFKFVSLRDKAPERKKPGEKLHNPLPLPKKHTTNALDYDYEVSDDDDYDID